MSHSQFHSIDLFILRHAWLNLWDKHMTTGRINQVTILQRKLKERKKKNKNTKVFWFFLFAFSSIRTVAFYKKNIKRQEPESVSYFFFFFFFEIEFTLALLLTETNSWKQSNQNSQDEVPRRGQLSTIVCHAFVFSKWLIHWKKKFTKHRNSIQRRKFFQRATFSVSCKRWLSPE